MKYNLFIAYDLISAGQNYERITDAIKKLGKWHQFQYSLYYVNTEMSAQEAYSFLYDYIDSNDRLCVINAESALVTVWDKPPLDAINTLWDGS